MPLTPDSLFILTLIIPNAIVIVAGWAKLSSRLTKIENDITWIIKNCDRCREQ